MTEDLHFRLRGTLDGVFASRNFETKELNGVDGEGMSAMISSLEPHTNRKKSSKKPLTRAVSV